ncbi:MAG: fasciclin domain-containing protein [Bacteroidetes bacterium]|nr:fasciclin domain-containing protein [Bacteroidota bacterium]MBS1930234.1 fasciclin domain-containing protein [Bacteroidota bacterium]
MKRLLLLFTAAIFAACNSGTDNKTTSSNGNTFDTHSQAGVVDSTSKPNVVQVAVGSKDHTTLVEAVKAANLVTSLSNAGPFTVFAPTNTAFDKLPKGTVEDLLKPAKQNDLINILQYHVYVGVLKADQLMEGQSLGMVNGDNIKITMENGKPVINGKAHIVASIPASNGIVHVIDEVLLPPAK